ncbi:MAG: transposase [Nitrospirales bacterium]
MLDQQYTREFQEAVVNQGLDGDGLVVEVARGLKMSDKMLSNWVRRGRREELLSHNGPTLEVTNAAAELSRLRMENA